MPSKAYYDLHIHSCLSPCGDDEMTPANIVGMASLKGLNILALTDHNSTLNCPAFFDICSNFNITPIAGTEVTTIEDIHVLTLFESLEGAMDFNEFLKTKRVLFKNKPEVFGRQLVVNSNDEIIDEEENLLINATTISIDEISKIANTYSGVAIPAHIEKDSNSLVAVLGTVVDSGFRSYEFKDLERLPEFKERYNLLNGKAFISNSDAHYLWDINEQINSFDIFSDLSDVVSVRNEVFSYLRGKVQ